MVVLLFALYPTTVKKKDGYDFSSHCLYVFMHVFTYHLFPRSPETRQISVVLPVELLCISFPIDLLIKTSLVLST